MTEMKKLSFEQRGKVYAKVFALMIKKSLASSYGEGYCDVFSQAINQLNYGGKTEILAFANCENSRRLLRAVWPEMETIKPKTNYREPGCSGSSGYWWADNRAGRITRLKKLQGILKEHYGVSVPIPEGI